MIAERTLHPRRLGRGPAGRRHRLGASVPVARGAASWSGTAWARFWDDRRAVQLKVILLAACLLAGMLLEGPR